MGQQSCVNIDSEIRSLVCLLNETPYIQTHSACSGHPTDPSQQWKHGWIAMVPIGDFCSFWKFLNELHVKLNHSSERPLELFRQVDAQALFSFTAPLLDVYCNFTLGATQRNNVRVWNLLLSTIQELFHEEEHTSVETVAEGANILIDKLHSTSHVQPDRTKFLGGRRVVCEAVWRYNSCRWCLDLVKYVNKRFEETWAQYDWLHVLYSGRTEELRAWKLDSMLYGEKDSSTHLRERFQSLIGRSQLFAHAFFVIQPVIRKHNVKRTREEHLQIWRLIELIAVNLIKKAR